MTDLHFTAKLEEFRLGDSIGIAETGHERITKVTEVGTILHFLCEDVTGIAFSGNMDNFH